MAGQISFPRPPQSKQLRSAPAPLRIAALDPEGLAILSAHMQDADIRVGDMAYLPEQRRFALAGARFDWYAAARGGCARARRAARRSAGAATASRRGGRAASRSRTWRSPWRAACARGAARA